MARTGSDLEQFVLEQICKRQGEDSDVAFARKLGIPRITWRHTRARVFPLGPTVLRAVVKVYPELQFLAAGLLLESDGSPAAGDEIPTAPAGSTPTEDEHPLVEARR